MLRGRTGNFWLLAFVSVRTWTNREELPGIGVDVADRRRNQPDSSQLCELTHTSHIKFGDKITL